MEIVHAKGVTVSIARAKLWKAIHFKMDPTHFYEHRREQEDPCVSS